MADIDELLKGSFDRLAEPADSAGVADLIRARVAAGDAGTTAEMQMFERFAIGIPVFHGGEPFGIIARLKYRLNSGKVSFHYELTRPDRSHQHAAMDLIKVVRDGLGGVPLRMGGIEG